MDEYGQVNPAMTSNYDMLPCMDNQTIPDQMMHPPESVPFDPDTLKQHIENGKTTVNFDAETPMEEEHLDEAMVGYLNDGDPGVQPTDGNINLKDDEPPIELNDTVEKPFVAEPVPDEGDGDTREGFEGKQEAAETLDETKTEDVEPVKDELDDMKNICRVCMAKENLIDIFEYESNLRYCDLVMSICTSLSISTRDTLPHFICTICTEKVKIAYDFKRTCETSDKEIRKNMKHRSRNKGRAGRQFLLVDAYDESSHSDAEVNDDDEFKISEVGSPDDSDASFEVGKKRKPPQRRAPPKRSSRSASKRSGAATRSTPNSSNTATSKRPVRPTIPATPDIKKLKRAVVYVDAIKDSSDEETTTPKAKRSRGSSAKKPAEQSAEKKSADKKSVEKKPTPKQEHPCDRCSKVCGTPHALREHKRVHDKESFTCTYCSKQFRLKAPFEVHMGKHKEELTCKTCKKELPSKLELRKHQQAHVESKPATCGKCKKTFSSQMSLQKHAPQCPAKKREGELTVGKDLFKTVAPLTSTYWSDSYSE